MHRHSPALRIASFEVIPVGLPFARTYATATGRLERREMLILRLDSSDGITGWGDAVPMSLRGGAGIPEVAAALAGACESLIGLELDPDPALAAVDALRRSAAAGARGPAQSAIDVALLDLLGRRDGEPAWRLLGADESRPVICNATLGADEPSAAAAAAADAARSGFGTIKVKAGDGADVDRVLAVRAASGPDTRLRIDANGSWSVARGARTPRSDGPGGARTRRAAMRDRPRARGAAGERPRFRSSATSRSATATRARRRSAAGAIDAATLKLAKVGGPHAALEIAALRAGLPVERPRQRDRDRGGHPCGGGDAQ